jgi:hypothetical protein
MNLQAALDGQQGGEQADGAGPDDQDDLGLQTARAAIRSMWS